MRMKKLLKSESGVMLPMAMFLLLVGAIVIVPLLTTVSTGSLIARHASFAESEDYAGDAGVEDAIWELLYNDLGSSIPSVNDTTSYVLSSPVNGETVFVSVEYLGTEIAEDHFEVHDTFSLGTGWTGDWSVTGMTGIPHAEEPYQGTHHLSIRNAGGGATRIVDLSSLPSAVSINFWARVKGFELGDNVELRFSPDGSTWSTARTWTSVDSDDTYHYHDIDLTPYTLSNQFRISVAADISNGGDKFFFDDMRISTPDVPIFVQPIMMELYFVHNLPPNWRYVLLRPIAAKQTKHGPAAQLIGDWLR